MPTWLLYLVGVGGGVVGIDWAVRETMFDPRARRDE
jgi:hypothetical protein